MVVVPLLLQNPVSHITSHQPSITLAHHAEKHWSDHLLSHIFKNNSTIVACPLDRYCVSCIGYRGPIGRTPGSEIRPNSLHFTWPLLTRYHLTAYIAHVLSKRRLTVSRLAPASVATSQSTVAKLSASQGHRSALMRHLPGYGRRRSLLKLR